MGTAVVSVSPRCPLPANASLLICPFGTCVGGVQLWLSGQRDVLERADASTPG